VRRVQGWRATRLETLLLDGLERLGGDAQADVALLLGPEDALVLQVDALQLFVADVREGHAPPIVRLLTRQHALAPGLTLDVCGRSANVGDSGFRVQGS